MCFLLFRSLMKPRLHHEPVAPTVETRNHWPELGLQDLSCWAVHTAWNPQFRVKCKEFRIPPTLICSPKRKMSMRSINHIGVLQVILWSTLQTHCLVVISQPLAGQEWLMYLTTAWWWPISRTLPLPRGDFWDEGKTMTSAGSSLSISACMACSSKL